MCHALTWIRITCELRGPRDGATLVFTHSPASRSYRLGRELRSAGSSLVYIRSAHHSA
jgi:hypothetical protein